MSTAGEAHLLRIGLFPSAPPSDAALAGIVRQWGDLMRGAREHSYTPSLSLTTDTCRADGQGTVPVVEGMGMGIGMKLDLLEQRLKEAERHIIDGKKHVEQQRLMVERLAGDGHETREARRLLHVLEELLVLHVQNRDRIRTEMRRRFNTVFR